MHTKLKTITRQARKTLSQL